MKKSEPCAICTHRKITQFYEIPKISTQHGGYNLGAPKDSYWVCENCLLEIFNSKYTKGRSELLDANLAYEFISSDLTILSVIYSEINDSQGTSKSEEWTSPNGKGDTSEIIKKMPLSSNILGFNNAPKSARDGFLKKTNTRRDPEDDDLVNRMLVPKEIELQLKKTIIGQDKLVKDLSIGAYKYLCSLTSPVVKRSNILIMGQSGTGKTESIKALAKILERPLLSINSSMLTPTGYRGENMNTVAEKLINLYGHERAKTSILYFDEFDKLVDPDGSSDTSDFKRAVLPELYKILDGDPMIATSHRGETISLDTKGMLIIMTGAFQKLEDNKNHKMRAKAVGLNESRPIEEGKKNFSFADLSRQDLIDYGFPVELIGRFSIRSYTTKFEAEDYLRILKTSNASVLKEYTQVFKNMRSTVEYTDGFLLDVIDKALQERTGARTMYSIIEERLLNELYNAEMMINKRVVINKDDTDIFEHEDTKDSGYRV